MTETQIPDFVWKALLDLFLKAVAPVGAVLSVVGALVVVWLWKKGTLPFIQKPSRHMKASASTHQGDAGVKDLLEQSNDWIERWIEAQDKIRGSMDGWANVLRALTGEVQHMGRTQKEMSDSYQIGIRGVHERLDKLVEKRL